MNKACKIFPRDLLRHMPAMPLHLPDRTVEELKEILGMPEIHKLSFNESPYGPSPAALIAIRQAADTVNLYHDLESQQLRQALAEHYGVAAGSIVLGNGADEIITLLAQTLLTGGDEAVIPVPTFGQYAAATMLTGAHSVLVPVRPDMSINLDAVAEAISVNTKIIFLCNPNNPTGLALRPDELRRFVAQMPGNIVIVLDEAYAEYADSEAYLSGISLAKEHANIVTVRTFSKIYGLAGMRLGYAIAHPQLAGFIDKVRNPFNLNSIAQAAGLAALRDSAFTNKVARLNAAERTWLSRELTGLGFHVYPSQTNFLFADTGRNCIPLCEQLMQRGIIIRPGTTWNLLSHVRISLGNHCQNSLLVDALREITQ